MPRIKVIQQDEAAGRLKEIYEELIDKRGKLAEVHKIQSLRPESIVKHIDLYMEIMFSRSELSRAEREMTGVVVSSCNGCEYCQVHHGEALNHYWKDSEKVESLKRNFKEIELKERELALCVFAETLTLHPGGNGNDDPTQVLRSAGFSDFAILDATLVVAYFNFVNRIVSGLDVKIEEDSAIGYKY